MTENGKEIMPIEIFVLKKEELVYVYMFLGIARAEICEIEAWVRKVHDVLFW